MTYAKGIVLAFATLREAGKTSILTQGLESFTSTGDNLVDVGLMTYVKDYLILGSRKYLV